MVHDLLYDTDLQFIYRENGRYDDLIMQLVNQIMGNIDRIHKNGNSEDETTNFKDFESFMTNIFSKSYD